MRSQCPRFLVRAGLETGYTLVGLGVLVIPMVTVGVA